VSLPPTNPFELVKRPKPPLDGYYWEDIVFVPARQTPSIHQRVWDRLDSLAPQVLLAIIAFAMFAALSAHIPRSWDKVLAFHRAGEDPVATGSISPTLRPTLSD
jgi:hypothetical protein